MLRSPNAPRRPFLRNSNASSRETTILSNGRFALISFFISSSIFGKSSGEIRCGEFDVVIKAVLYRRAGGELSVGPEIRRMAVVSTWAARVADALQLGHLRAFIQSFAFFLHQER